MMNVIKKLVIKGELPIKKKTIDIISYYVLPSILFITFLFLLMTDLNGLRYISNKFAYVAIHLFSIIMFAKPLSQIFSKIKIFKKIVSLRRELGILIFYFAFFHMAGLITFYNYLSINSFIEANMMMNFMLMGTLSFILMFILYLTSNNISVRFFKRKWRVFQNYFGYLSYILVLLHLALFKGGFSWYLLLGIYIVLKLYFYISNKLKK